MVEEKRNIHREVLPNGLIVLTEEMQHIRSVSIGIWIKTGSRDEDLQWNGISHFIEHMVFKGTKHRSAEEIARQVDSIGGNMDAFTAKECVCFNVKVLDDHLPIAMDVLSDLVLNPVFDGADITRERGVILEEIKMDEDSPDYLVHEIFTQNFWKDHPLGKPILGTKETVKKFEQPVVLDFYGQRFAPGNLIICAAGNLKHAQFVELVNKHFAQMPPKKNGFHSPQPKIVPRIIMRNKKALEQVQICVGVPSHPIAHGKRYASYILNTLLGGGMSSRLFQNIRERQGLAYAIYSDLNPYRDTGCLSVYAGTSRESAGKVVQSIVSEFRKLKTETVPPEELRRAKDQLKGSLMLSLESSTARMSNLARQEMYFDRFYTLDELIEKIEGVTAEELKELAEQFFHTDSIAVTVLGNLNGLKLTREQLAC
ncbi:MAG: peptidase M16 [Acidobacteria bacterium]|jgi:predicted Zn-dependent peptidase|nr:MAG: peptidase M16 [Acidobacteriales bacterium 13_1_40CM_3_55_5]PYX00556.1 MAG: peptidase M16 [Acidobacteriota bacterium]PYX14132.1 MAG: peptidase M16 [Acidobacteriota bacterium]